MATKVIGLDLGHRAVKAAVLNGSYRGYDVVDFRTHPLPLEELEAGEPEDEDTGSFDTAEGGSVDGEEVEAVEVQPDEGPTLRDLQLREAAALLDSLDTTDATLVVALPASKVSSWVVEVPFTQPKQIAAVLHGVLEERVPFDLGEMLIHDHVVAAGPKLLDGGPGSRLFCAMTRKAEVRKVLRELSGLGVDPRHLPVDAGALLNLQRFLPGSAGTNGNGNGKAGAGRTVAIVDIGHEVTQVCGISGGEPMLMRAIDWGGADLDGALGSHYSFGPGELDDYKRRVVTVAGHSTEPQVQEMVELVRAAVRPLVAMLRTTLIAFEDEHDVEVEALYLTGGSSQIRGLADWLHEELGVPVELLALPPTPGDVPEPGPEHAMAYALALRAFAPAKPQQVGFRIAEFAYKRNVQRLQRVGVAAVAMLAVLALIGIGMSVVRGSRLKARDTQLMDDIRASVKATFPTIADSALTTSSQAVSVYMGEMEAINAKADEIDPSKRQSAFDRLRDLSRAVPKDHKIDVDYLEITGDAIKLRANTDKFETVDNIEAAVKRYPGLGSAAAHDKVKARDGTTKFEMTIPLGVEEGEEEE